MGWLPPFWITLESNLLKSISQCKNLRRLTLNSLGAIDLAKMINLLTEFPLLIELDLKVDKDISFVPWFPKVKQSLPRLSKLSLTFNSTSEICLDDFQKLLENSLEILTVLNLTFTSLPVGENVLNLVEWLLKVMGPNLRHLTLQHLLSAPTDLEQHTL